MKIKKNKNDFVVIDNSNTTLNIKNRNIFIKVIKFNKYIYKILQSFEDNSANIIHQFEIDYIRSVFKINGNTETNISLFKDYFEFRYLENPNIYYNLLALCTQASFGTPIILLSNCIKNNNIYIGELKYKKKTLIFNIITNNNELVIKIKKTLRLFYINKNSEDITINIINIEVYIPFTSKKDVIITYNFYKKK